MRAYRQLRDVQKSLFVAALLLGGAPAVAQPAVAQPSGTPAAAAGDPPLRVLWTSDDPECDGADVAARALRLVSPGVTPRPLRATVQVQREGDGRIVRLETESADQTGRRILRADSCDELEKAVALLLAMTLESKGDPQPATPEPAAPAQPTPPVPTPAEDLTDEPPPPPAASSPGVSLGAFARLDAKAGLGLQPGIAHGLGASAGIRIGDIDLGVDAAYWPATSQDTPQLDGSVSILRRSLGLRGCWSAWSSAGLTLAPCLGAGATFFDFESVGVEEPSDESVPPLLNLSGAADLRYAPLGPHLSMVLSAGLTWEKKQPFQVEIRDPSAPEDADAADPAYVEVYRTKGLGPRLELGLDARF